MRLKVVNRGRALDHANHIHGDNCAAAAADDDDQEVIKKEVEEANHDYQRSKSVICDDNLTLAQFSQTKTAFPDPAPSPPTPSPFAQGKRNKSKETKDHKGVQIKRKKKPSPKFNNVVSVLPGKITSCKREKAASPDLVKSPTIIRAEEVQLSLGPEFPSFVKLLVRSHVSSCFWMGLPTPFCKSHLPRKDTAVILEDESGEQFEIKYIAEKTGLSAGWRKFAVGQKLVEGDVLIFHLIETTKFKVYIIRANDMTEVDGALSLLNLDAQTKKIDAENKERAPAPLKIKKRKQTNPLPLIMVQKKNKRPVLPGAHQLGQLVEQSGNDSEEVGSEVLEGSKFLVPYFQFKDVKSFEDFHILVNGLCIDSELPEHIRLKYYELCCSKSAFLHNRFLPGLYTKLAAGIIGETVNIADAIRACQLTTSEDEFAVWEKSLRSFELLGMNVGFLRNRLHLLRSLVFESGGASDAKRCIEARSGRTQTENEIRNLEVKLIELKEASKKFDADIETLKSKAEKYAIKFQKEVDAPW